MPLCFSLRNDTSKFEKKLMGLEAVLKTQILIRKQFFFLNCFKYKATKNKYKATYLLKIDSYVMDKSLPKCAL